MKEEGKRRGRLAAFLAGLSLLALLSVLLVFDPLKAEEKWPDENRIKRMETVLEFGSYWAPVKRLFLDLKAMFPFVQRQWREKTGRKHPFPGVPAAIAERQWYSAWVQDTCRLLGERGWKLVGMDDGMFMFSRDEWVHRAEVPPPFRKTAEEGGYDPNNLSDLPMPDPIPGPGGHFSVPGDSVPNPTGAEWEGSFRQSRGVLVPPTARALRIYSPAPLDAGWYDFRWIAPFLHIPEIGRRFFRLEYDGDRANVMTLRLLRPKGAEDFWDWRFLVFRIHSVHRYREKTYHMPTWIAWEFLDEDGKPLPADMPIATRYFPENFDEIFEPIY